MQHIDSRPAHNNNMPSTGKVCKIYFLALEIDFWIKYKKNCSKKVPGSAVVPYFMPKLFIFQKNVTTKGLTTPAGMVK